MIRIEIVDQDRRPVLDYWRCAMLPLSPGAGETGAADDIAAMGHEVDLATLTDPTSGWRLDVTRALSNLVTVVGWRHCDHVGPVREGDLLTSTVSIGALRPRADGGGLVDVRVLAPRAARTESDPCSTGGFWAVMA